MELLNSEILNSLLNEYKEGFSTRWKNESFKWKAVKCFQDNWSINDANFAEMFEKATKKTDTLLVGPHSLPRGMILEFAKVDAEATRQMFVDLYDESRDLRERISSFMESAELLRSKYNPEGWKNHFQGPSEISIYLWLRYPEKYFIYKPSVYISVAKKLGVETITGKHKRIDKLIACFKLYNDICTELSSKQDICNMVNDAVKNDPECFADEYYRTLTTDFAYFVAKYLDVDEQQKSGIISTAEALMDILKKQQDIIPDKHDGSYELMRETIKAYSSVDDYTTLDYTDMDLIYLSAVSTLKDGCEAKKDRVRQNQHLSEEVKNHLLNVIDDIWDKTILGNYSNSKNNETNQDSFGMFGTGFKSFSQYATKETWKKQIQDLIKMLVKINSLDDSADDDVIFGIAESVVNHPTAGLQAGTVSIILHCLKPYTFPIINGNQNMGDIFGDLGISLKQKQLAETYIANCRNIKTFRDTHFHFKNYRVFDLVARNYKKSKHEKDEYGYFLSKDQWYEFILEDKEKYPETFVMLRKMLEMGGEASTSELAEELGGSVATYNSRGSNFGKRARKKYNLPEYVDENGKKWEYIIPFDGYSNIEDYYIWVLRTELREALEEMVDIQEVDEDKIEFDHNIILYGPPGTGKTYHTAYYAVAICDNIPLDKVKEMEYADIIDRYNELKEKNRIDFITFHQSYGYEEFIEGIRPLLEDDSNTSGSDIKYELKSGKFKEFCKNALNQVSSYNKEWKLNNSPTVWKVSLEGTGDNETRRECMENNHIRIGWEEYGEELSFDAEFKRGGKAILNAFYNKMKVGDIVVSCYSSETTDAIGIVTGDAEWRDEYKNYNRTRDVKWLVKGINENIVKINNDKPMVLASVYKMDINAEDILNIVRKHQHLPEKNKSKKNYVFIIDEINRGNISKIFGELITLIEDTKRIGASESMQLKLAYSEKPFGVPENVYIIGTMNTADRSIALMDTALRRRFRFIEMMPEPDVIKGVVIEDNDIQLDVSEMLDIINKRIECLYDREHTIGHAFFTSLMKKNEPSIENLGEIFEKSVIPLLQEYFYEDYEKIRLVLGDNAKNDESIEFITRKANESNIFRGNVSEEDYNDYNYKINKKAFNNIMSYKGISEKL